ncbi:MAG: hypothetical protein A2Y60_01825 [Chloroflexi bacterium RBG_13_54_9]|nr:MAG: hypothetical protein A2Y60_01825 [Chloroflexi bacterium RBG_13_54_9]
METIDSESVRDLSDDELHKLGNRAWYNNNVELCWLTQAETIRRQRGEEMGSGSAPARHLSLVKARRRTNGA